ncbi:MAG: hypothetical protein K2J01_04530 [Clostridiales bacterium]|nr:hypothetical protein [Clostridiales bacterium]
MKIDYQKTIDELKESGLIKPNDKYAVCYFHAETVNYGVMSKVITSTVDYIIAANADELKLFAIHKKTGEYIGEMLTFKKDEIRYAKRIKERNFIWASKGIFGGRYIGIRFIAEKFTHDYVIPKKFNGFEQIGARTELFEFVKNTYNPYYTELQKLYKQEKAHKVTLNYADIEKSALAKDPGINTVSIGGVDFVIKEDALFSAFGHFKADAYGTVDGIAVKFDLVEKAFLENHVDVNPEYIEKIAALLQGFEAHYNTIVDRIALETANYLNAQNLRDEPYTQEEVKPNIDSKSIKIAFPNDCAFCAWLDDESAFYVEYDDGSYRVDISTDEESDT